MLHDDELSLTQPNVTEAKVRALTDAIDAYDVWAVHIGPVARRRGKAYADVMKIVGRDDDRDLVRHAKKLKKVVKLEHDVFGKLRLDRSVNVYQGKCAWNGRLIHVDFALDKNGDHESALAAGTKLWKKQKTIGAALLECSVKRLLALKNGSWLDGDEKKVTAAVFKARMKLRSVSVNPDGRFTFEFDDGDLFWGHRVSVSGSVKKGPTDASI